MDNMLKIEQGSTPGALSEGQRLEELAAGQVPAGLAAGGPPRDLGPGEVEKMFGPAPTPRQRLEAQGIKFEESGAEMGGGGDAIDDWAVKKGGYDGLLRQIQQNGWADNAVWKLPDGTQISVAEVKRRAAVASPPPPPEPQPAPRPGDWRDSLPPEQKNRVSSFEKEIAGFDLTQLRLLEQRIKSLQAVVPIDGWQSKKIQEADADLCLKIVGEKLQSTFPNPNQVNQLSPERLDPMQNISEAAKAHIQFLIDKFRKDKSLEKLDFPDLVAYVQAEYRKAGLIGRNSPIWLLPPHLKRELLPIFGLPMEMPLLLDPKEKNA